MRLPRRRRGEASRGVVPAETDDTGDASPTRPAAESEAFSSSASAAFLRGQPLLHRGFRREEGGVGEVTHARGVARGPRATRAGVATTIADVGGGLRGRAAAAAAAAAAALALARAGFSAFPPFSPRGAARRGCRGRRARRRGGFRRARALRPGALRGGAGGARARRPAPLSRALYAAFASASAANVPKVTVRLVVGS